LRRWCADPDASRRDDGGPRQRLPRSTSDGLSHRAVPKMIPTIRSPRSYHPVTSRRRHLQCDRTRRSVPLRPRDELRSLHSRWVEATERNAARPNPFRNDPITFNREPDVANMLPGRNHVKLGRRCRYARAARRKTAGVVPASWPKKRVMCSWWENPQSKAICAMEQSVSRSKRFARSRRNRTRYL